MSPSRSTVINFEASITLPDDQIDAAGGLEQAVQDEIGHTGAALICVTKIRDLASDPREGRKKPGSGSTTRTTEPRHNPSPAGRSPRKAR